MLWCCGSKLGLACHVICRMHGVLCPVSNHCHSLYLVVHNSQMEWINCFLAKALTPVVGLRISYPVPASFTHPSHSLQSVPILSPLTAHLKHTQPSHIRCDSQTNTPYRTWALKRAALKPSSGQNSGSTKIATFRKAQQISMERPKLLQSALSNRKDADLTLAKFL